MVAMNPTQNTLEPDVRGQMVSDLNARLAECLDLYFQAKQAHWNVKGRNFIALHGLFDDVADHLADFSDTLAERAVALGGVAAGTVQSVAQKSGLAAYPVELQDGERHVEFLSKSLAHFGENLRASINRADEAGDQGTADLFTELLRGVDKDLWFVEAHLQRG